MGTERTRCRKGDMKIDIQGIELRVTTFVNRDTVRQEVRDRIAARIPELQHLAMTIGQEVWSVPVQGEPNG